VVKRIPISLIVVVLIITLPIIVKWVREKVPEPDGTHVAASNHADTFRGDPTNKLYKKEQQTKDCDEWANMNVKEKKRNYRADPERWARCLYEEEVSGVDRVYITGKVSR
jgi:hypothetical protein